MLSTMIASMWLNNVGATLMIIPIIESILAELEAKNCVKAYKIIKTEENEEIKVPTSVTTCFYLSAAYAATIGGIGTLAGSGTNLITVGIIDAIFPNGRQVTYVTWLWFGIPIMLFLFCCALILLQIAYLGLCRPKSKDTEAIKEKQKCIETTGDAIKKIQEELGPMGYKDIAIGTLFIIIVTAWSTRTFVFYPGWGALFKVEIDDSAISMLIIMLYFFLPSEPTFIYAFSKDDQKRPKHASLPLLPWVWTQKRIPWGLLLTVGSGYVIAEGMKTTGLGTTIGEKTAFLDILPPVAVMMFLTFIMVTLTQFMHNSVVACLLVPVACFISKAHKVHPLYYAIPVGISASFAWCSPYSTPPNLIVAENDKVDQRSMAKVGFFLSIVSMLVIFAVFPLLSTVFDVGNFPEWAQDDEVLTTVTTLAPTLPPENVVPPEQVVP